MGMPQAIAQSFTRDAQDLLRFIASEPLDGSIIHAQLKPRRVGRIDRRHQLDKLGTQLSPARNLSRGTCNVLAHIADHTVEASYDLPELRRYLARIVADQALTLLQPHADRVDGLHDVVVQVPRQALALLERLLPLLLAHAQ